MKSRVFCAILALLMVLTCGCVAPAEPTAPATEPPTQPTDPPTEPTEPPTEPPTDPPTSPPTDPPTEPYVPEVYPNTVGIYIPAADGTRNRKRIAEFVSKRTAKKDIDCFEIFASHDSVVSGSSFKSMWKNIWQSHGEHENARIGFYIEFQLTDGTVISQTIRKPGDVAWFYDYLEIYMYDDINQPAGAWYSHLEDKDMDEDTIISSIKLTSGSKISEVGTIFLTAFIYNAEDNFDDAGNYIGTVKETIAIFDE